MPLVASVQVIGPSSAASCSRAPYSRPPDVSRTHPRRPSNEEAPSLTHPRRPSKEQAPGLGKPPQRASGLTGPDRILDPLTLSAAVGCARKAGRTVLIGSSRCVGRSFPFLRLQLCLFEMLGAFVRDLSSCGSSLQHAPPPLTRLSSCPHAPSMHTARIITIVVPCRLLLCAR